MNVVQPAAVETTPIAGQPIKPAAGNPPRFSWFRILELIIAIAALSALVCWVTIPRLPAGICFDDSGDIQLASATLGIAHPPGYPGYATLGFLLTRIFPADPAYVISVTCFVTGLFALVACLVLQLQLGVNIWFATAVTLLLAAHPRFWTNLRAPEVYMPTLALLALSVCFLVRYSNIGLRRYLVVAVLLFGFAMGNRPPVLFAVPFFLIAWIFAQRRWSVARRGGWADLVWMVPLAASPTVYAIGYVYVRDRPDVCHNYIEAHNEEMHVLPQSTEGARAKLRRAIWEVSAEQFRHYMGTDWRAFVGKARWLRTQVAYEHPIADMAVFLMLTAGIEPADGDWFTHIDMYILSLLFLFGLIMAFRRNPVIAWLLTGLIVSSAAFVLAYQVYGQAADLLPLLFAGAVAIGMVGSKLFPTDGHWVRQTAACTLSLGAAVIFVREASAWPLASTGINATEYLESLDLATFPESALICANWTEAVPMRYAQCTLTNRRDIHIVTVGPRLWLNVARRVQDRPVYTAEPFESEGLCTLESFRSVYHCMKNTKGDSPSP